MDPRRLYCYPRCKALSLPLRHKMSHREIPCLRAMRPAGGFVCKAAAGRKIALADRLKGNAGGLAGAARHAVLKTVDEVAGLGMKPFQPDDLCSDGLQCFCIVVFEFRLARRDTYAMQDPG